MNNPEKITVENGIIRQANGRFMPGNKEGKGRIPISEGGKPNPATLAKQAIERDIGDVIQALIDNAKAGDTGAAKILLDRVSPVLKSIEHLGLDGSTLPQMTINKTTTNIIEAPAASKPDTESNTEDHQE